MKRRQDSPGGAGRTVCFNYIPENIYYYFLFWCISSRRVHMMGEQPSSFLCFMRFLRANTTVTPRMIQGPPPRSSCLQHAFPHCSGLRPCNVTNKKVPLSMGREHLPLGSTYTPGISHTTQASLGDSVPPYAETRPLAPLILETNPTLVTVKRFYNVTRS